MRKSARTVVKAQAGKLTHGTVISQETLCEWFDINQPKIDGMEFAEASKAISTYNYNKLYAYTSLNTLLRPSGRTITQEKGNYRIRVGASQIAPVIEKQLRRIDTLESSVSLLKTFRG